jgi:cell wall-associated NlpC family hydrolase
VSFRQAIAGLLIASCGVGCAHGFYVYPGPLGSLGKAPPPVEQPELEPGSVWDGLEPEGTPAAVEQGGDGSGSAGPEAPPSARARKQGADVAKAAAHYLGAGKLRHGGQSFRYDCSGMVMAAYARAGLQLAGSSESMLRMAKEAGVFHKRKRPWVGDVAFFGNTYDKNGNGRLDDPITHVAIVTSVDDDGTVHMIHKGGKGVTRLVMNLRSPGEHSDAAAKEINGYLRARRSGDHRGTRYLAGELWIGFGSFWKVL